MGRYSSGVGVSTGFYNTIHGGEARGVRVNYAAQVSKAVWGITRESCVYMRVNVVPEDWSWVIHHCEFVR